MTIENPFSDGETFDRWNNFREEYAGHSNSLDSLLKKNGCITLFELGIGTGLFTQKMIELGYEVAGIDNNNTLLEHLKKKGIKAKAELSDLKDYSFATRYGAIYSFEGPLLFARTQDRIFFESYLEETIEGEFDSLVDALKKIKNALDQNGSLYISITSIDGESSPPGTNDKVLIQSEYKQGIVERKLTYNSGSEYSHTETRRKIALNIDDFKTHAKSAGFSGITESDDGRWMVLN